MRIILACDAVPPELRHHRGEEEGILFRVPDQLDAMLCIGRLPVLQFHERPPQSERPDIRIVSAPEEESDPQAEKLLKESVFLDRLLCRCAIAPTLIPDNPADIPAGAFPVQEIPFEARIIIGATLLSRARWSREAAVELAPLSPIAAPSSGSTPSHSDTASSPQSSLAQDDSQVSKPSPSTGNA